MDGDETTVAKYMAKRRCTPSQGWRTFVHNHADAIASFVVPTISVGLVYGLRKRGIIRGGCLLASTDDKTRRGTRCGSRVPPTGK